MRPIDADKLLLSRFVEPRTEWHQGWNDALSAAAEQAPTIDVVVKRRGLRGRSVCSNCGATCAGRAVYCPNCGAKLNPLNDIETEIVLSLAECDMSISRVAKKLYMHRNNVDYHVRRIREKTGLDPRSFYELGELLKQVNRTEDET